MTTPQFIRAWRLATALITIVLILLVVLGMVGVGPLVGVLGPSAPKIGI